MLATPLPADELVLTGGRRYRGLVVEKTPQYVVFKIYRPGGGRMTVRYSMSKVESLNIDGKEPVFEQPKPRPPATRPAPKPTPVPEPSPEPAPRPAPPGRKPVGTTRTRAEIEALIEKIGRTPPDWWDSAQLNYPRTLDLTGKYQSKKWEPQKKVGAYMFSVVIPNPRRWRSAIKLLHHVLTVRKDDPPRLAQAMAQLANSYCRFEKDWARGAFWYRKALKDNQRPSAHDVVGLAECYFRLGNESMSAALLRSYGLHRLAYAGSIKLWADMGEIDLALVLAEAMTRSRRPAFGHLLVGNIYRRTGKYSMAVASYQEAALLSSGDNKQKLTFHQAQGNIEAIRLYEALDLSKIRDGAYTGTAVSYRGPLTVEVVIADGRMDSVKVTAHKDDIFFTSLTDVPAQIVDTQGVKGIDAVSGATVTSMAIVNATAKALASGMNP